LSSSSSGEDYNNDIEKDAIDKGKSSIKKYKPTLRPGDDSKQICFKYSMNQATFDLKKFYLIKRPRQNKSTRGRFHKRATITSQYSHANNPDGFTGCEAMCHFSQAPR